LEQGEDSILFGPSYYYYDNYERSTTDDANAGDAKIVTSFADGFDVGKS
jgi:hypothetical protein